MDEISSLDWDIVPKDGYEYDWVEEGIKEIKDFLNNPNHNGESFNELIRQLIKDILEIDAGIIVKVFDINSYDFNEIEPKSGAPMLKPFGERHMTEIYIRDGASFLKEIDKFGFEKGHWQYSYQIPAHPMWFNKEEIVYCREHPRSMSPYGYARTQAVLDVIKSLHYSTLYNKRFFEETPIPDGALSLLDTNETEMANFLTWWNGEFKAQPHKLAVINKDVKWQPFNVTNRELEFLETQKWYYNLVISMFGLTPAEMGITEDVNRATSATQSELVKRKGIRPFLKLIEGYLNKGVLSEFGYEGVEFQFIYDDPAEKNARLNNWQMELNMGVKTVNEVRLEMGLEPIDGGDMSNSMNNRFYTTPESPQAAAGKTDEEDKDKKPEGKEPKDSEERESGDYDQVRSREEEKDRSLKRTRSVEDERKNRIHHPYSDSNRPVGSFKGKEEDRVKLDALSNAKYEIEDKIRALYRKMDRLKTRQNLGLVKIEDSEINKLREDIDQIERKLVDARREYQNFRDSVINKSIQKADRPIQAVPPGATGPFYAQPTIEPPVVTNERRNELKANAGIDPEQVKIGQQNEMKEHPSFTPEQCEQIAIDHLQENPDYYSNEAEKKINLEPFRLIGQTISEGLATFGLATSHPEITATGVASGVLFRILGQPKYRELFDGKEEQEKSFNIGIEKASSDLKHEIYSELADEIYKILIAMGLSVSQAAKFAQYFKQRMRIKKGIDRIEREKLEWAHEERLREIDQRDISDDKKQKLRIQSYDRMTAEINKGIDDGQYYREPQQVNWKPRANIFQPQNPKPTERVDPRHPVLSADLPSPWTSQPKDNVDTYPSMLGDTYSTPTIHTWSEEKDRIHCPICGQPSLSYLNMMEQMPEDIRCTQCGARFKSEELLNAKVMEEMYNVVQANNQSNPITIPSWSPKSCNCELHKSVDLDMDVKEYTGIDISKALPMSIEYADSREYKKMLMSFLDDMHKKDVDKIIAVLKNSMRSGESMREIAKKINSIIGNPTRAELIARTEMVRITNEGNRELMKQRGATKVRWYAAPEDGRRCAKCAALNGKIYKLEEAPNPSDIHPNCRCVFTEIYD